MRDRSDMIRTALARLFDAWRAGDALHSAAYFSPTATYTERGRTPIVGRDAIVQHFTKFFRDGPRFEFFVDETLIDGERAAVRYRFATFDERGRRSERPGCAFVGFIDGAIVEWREYEG